MHPLIEARFDAVHFFRRLWFLESSFFVDVVPFASSEETTRT